MTPTPLDVLVLFLQWVGMAVGLWLWGARLYAKAEYDAWGPSNVDHRIFWGGGLVGIGFCWFFCGPAVLLGSVS